MTMQSITLVYLCLLTYSVSGLFIGYITRLQQINKDLAIDAWNWRNHPFIKGPPRIPESQQMPIPRLSGWLWANTDGTTQELDCYEFPPMRSPSNFEVIREAAQRLQITIDQPTWKTRL